MSDVYKEIMGELQLLNNAQCADFSLWCVKRIVETGKIDNDLAIKCIDVVSRRIAGNASYEECRQIVESCSFASTVSNYELYYLLSCASNAATTALWINEPTTTWAVEAAGNSAYYSAWVIHYLNAPTQNFFDKTIYDAERMCQLEKIKSYTMSEEELVVWRRLFI